MNYFFNANNFLTKNGRKYLSKNNRRILKELTNYINKSKQISTTSQYNNTVKKIVSIVKNIKILPKAKFAIYHKEIIPISKSAPLTEKTPWGGVSLKNVDVEKNYIRKLLVVAKWGVLGFEIHKLKHEKLKILEGICMALYPNHAKSNWKQGGISVKLAAAGDKFEFLPKDEHGIITLTDCVIEETSTNHLDDLVYIFKASQVT